MKNVVLITLLLFISNCLFSQNYKTVTYLDILSFQLPENFTVQDNNGFKWYMANDSVAQYQCIIISSKYKKFKKLKKLEENYDQFYNGMLKEMPGFNQINKEFIDFENLHALRSTFSVVISDKAYSLENLTVFIKGDSFSFSVIMPIDQRGSFENFIKTVKFNPNLNIDSQLK